MFFLHVVYQTLQVEQRGVAFIAVIKLAFDSQFLEHEHTAYAEQIFLLDEVSKRMFQGVWKGYDWRESHVGYVTNGVHMPTWAASEWKAFYTEKLAYDQRIGIDAVENAEHGGGIALICEPFGLEFAFYEVDKLVSPPPCSAFSTASIPMR